MPRTRAATTRQEALAHMRNTAVMLRHVYSTQLLDIATGNVPHDFDELGQAGEVLDEVIERLRETARLIRKADEAQ